MSDHECLKIIQILNCWHNTVQGNLLKRKDKLPQKSCFTISRKSVIPILNQHKVLIAIIQNEKQKLSRNRHHSHLGRVENLTIN